MNVEEKFRSMCNIDNTTGDNLPTNEINIDVAIQICNEAIKQAKIDVVNEVEKFIDLCSNNDAGDDICVVCQKYYKFKKQLEDK